MTRQVWREHMSDLGLVTKGRPESPEFQTALAHMRTCAICKMRRTQARANKRRREREQAMRDLGLVRTSYGWE